MEIYLVRHGIAEQRSPDIKEEERSLTKEGWQKTEKVAKRLRQLSMEFDLIITSPLARARQTAEILRDYKLSSQLEETSHLAPEGNIHAWVSDWLQPRQYPSQACLALVGHEPNLSEWAEIFLWGEARGSLVLKKAGIIGLQLPETISPIGNSQMFWLTPPKFLI